MKETDKTTISRLFGLQLLGKRLLKVFPVMTDDERAQLSYLIGLALSEVERIHRANHKKAQKEKVKQS